MKTGPQKTLGKDLRKDLTAAYGFVSSENPEKFRHPNDVQLLFQDLKVREGFLFLVGETMIVAKRGNGRVLPMDKEKLNEAFVKFAEALFANRHFASLAAPEQNNIVATIRDFAGTEIAAKIVYIHSPTVEQFFKGNTE